MSDLWEKTMSRLDVDIKTLIDVAKWEPLQDALAKATGTAIVTVDYKGIPITKHSRCTEFCKLVRDSAVARKRCFKCDALAGLEAVRLSRPFIYLCHCGIVDAAVPVMLGEQYLGAVMFGQVRIANADDDNTRIERLLSEISSFDPASGGRDSVEMREKYRQIPVMNYERVLETAELIEALVRYMVDKFVETRTESQTYEWMLRYAIPPLIDGKAPQLGVDMSELCDPDSAPAPRRNTVSVDSPVYPAINYVEDHRHQMVGMREMANLCHLSASYFSKLFLREVGENYTDWVNRRKIEWAKEMLRDSSESVTSIASSLGYMDTSYFIKVFKKFEGTTPLVYRQHKYK